MILFKPFDQRNQVFCATIDHYYSIYIEPKRILNENASLIRFNTFMINIKLKINFCFRRHRGAFVANDMKLMSLVTTLNVQLSCAFI